MAEEKLNTVKEVDLRGLRCPLPVLKARSILRKMNEGDRVWIVTDDPLALIDVPNFARETDQGLLDQSAGLDEEARFLLERRGRL